MGVVNQNGKVKRHMYWSGLVEMVYNLKCPDVHIDTGEHNMEYMYTHIAANLHEHIKHLEEPATMGDIVSTFMYNNSGYKRTDVEIGVCILLNKGVLDISSDFTFSAKPELKTHAVLTCTTGRLMGSIEDLYTVGTFFIGREVYTHELTMHLDKITSMVLSLYPDFPTTATKENWQDVKSDAESKYGDTMYFPNEMRGSISDGMSPVETLEELIEGYANVV